jgi:hypothetical protein
MNKTTVQNITETLGAFTCMHCMLYNVGIMQDSKLQLTIRGLDPATKEALVKKANQQGISLNKYALRALRHSAGTNDSEERYRAMKQFLKSNHMSKSDKKAFDEAIAWSDKTSLEKQRKDEHDAGF